MTRLDTKLELPDDLAKQAKEAGLLEPKAMRTTLQEQLKKRAGEKLRAAWARMPREELTPEIEQELVEEVRRRRIARITDARSKVAAAGIAPISMEEIQAEIEADRIERRNR